MKKTFIQYLPVAAALLLATSCGKDDNSPVVDNIATPEPVHEVVATPTARTITITGKVNQNLSKVAADADLKLSFEGGEEFTIYDQDNTECGTLTIQGDKETYSATINAKNIDNGGFTAKLGTAPVVTDLSSVTGYKTLAEALHAAYYEIPFSVKNEGDDKYSIGDVTAEIKCAFVKALSSKTISLGAVASGNFYIVPVGEEVNDKVTSAEAGKIYKVGGKDALSDEKTFSVSDAKTVRFSKGNLMYRPDFGYFFADNQWTYIGKANDGTENQNKNVDGTIDLFGWGAWLSGQEPTQTSTYSSVYLPSVGSVEFTGSSAIGEQWATLSTSEWEYLFNSRGGNSYAKATVNGVPGVILLPDGWNTETYTLNKYNNADDDYAKNVITAAQWPTLESAGAVFLPAAGRRLGSSVYNAGSYGVYWSSSADGTSRAWYVRFYSGYLNPATFSDRYRGFSVRLVCTLQD